MTVWEPETGLGKHSMIRKLALLGLIAVAPVDAGAAEWLEDGKPAGATSWRKAWGNHGAMLHLKDE
jgi:hypothetical protein